VLVFGPAIPSNEELTVDHAGSIQRLRVTLVLPQYRAY
jgi:hypothetical protein